MPLYKHSNGVDTETLVSHANWLAPFYIFDIFQWNNTHIIRLAMCFMKSIWFLRCQRIAWWLWTDSYICERVSMSPSHLPTFGNTVVHWSRIQDKRLIDDCTFWAKVVTDVTAWLVNLQIHWRKVSHFLSALRDYVRFVTLKEVLNMSQPIFPTAITFSIICISPGVETFTLCFEAYVVNTIMRDGMRDRWSLRVLWNKGKGGSYFSDR